MVYQQVQYVLVRPDGREVVLAEFVEDMHAPVDWAPTVRADGVYGKRVKGPAGDAEWAEQKLSLVELAEGLRLLEMAKREGATCDLAKS